MIKQYKGRAAPLAYKYASFQNFLSWKKMKFLPTYLSLRTGLSKMMSRTKNYSQKYFKNMGGYTYAPLTRCIMTGSGQTAHIHIQVPGKVAVSPLGIDFTSLI